jgi:fatty acid CoA ligase FadD9
VELQSWVEQFLDIHLIEVYGSTEDSVVLVDGRIRRPPVSDYKMVDVPGLGYFGTDRPHPRGESLVSSRDVIPGYYKRPEVTAELFDAEGWYHTGDVFAEIAPDELTYVDRRNNVLKLLRGEFVTVSKLEAAVKPLLSEALQSIARDAGLRSYEIPRDFLVETTPFTWRTVCSPASASWPAPSSSSTTVPNSSSFTST